MFESEQMQGQTLARVPSGPGNALLRIIRLEDCFLKMIYSASRFFYHQQ